MMPRPSREEEMLDAALHCFAEKGYDGARVSEIATRAGVSDGALYRHFSSKEEIAQRVYGLAMEAYSSALEQAAQGDDPVDVRLRRCLQAALALYRSDRNAMTFALLRQPSFMPGLPAGFVYPIQIVQRLIAEGQGTGVVRDGDPKLLAAIYLGCLLRPLIVSQLATPGSFDLEQQSSHDNTIFDSAWAAVRS